MKSNNFRQLDFLRHFNFRKFWLVSLTPNLLSPISLFDSTFSIFKLQVQLMSGEAFSYLQKIARSECISHGMETAASCLNWVCLKD